MLSTITQDVRLAVPGTAGRRDGCCVARDRAPGYGIITFDRSDHTITMANWPRWVDPSSPGAKPYPGWPITIRQEKRDRVMK
jgi:hypothetical protein